jgi:hypothetical protein
MNVCRVFLDRGGKAVHSGNQESATALYALAAKYDLSLKEDIGKVFLAAGRDSLRSNQLQEADVYARLGSSYSPGTGSAIVEAHCSKQHHCLRNLARMSASS